MRRNVEAHFLAPKDRRRKLVLHQILSAGTSGCRAANLQRCRQRGRELDNAVVEKRRPHFQRMRHAHAVRLVQDVVGKIVSLVERQVGSQVVGPRAKPDRKSARIASSAGGSSACSRSRFSASRKGSIPIDVRPLGRHQLAFKKPLQLIFEADFLIGNRPGTPA